MSLTADRRQGINSSVAFKAPCRLASTANLTLSGLQTIDGTLPSASDTHAMRRILVRSQTLPAENGVYVMAAGVWERDKDWDSGADFVQGTRIYVHSGSTASGAYVLTSTVDADFMLGTDSVTFTASAVSDLNIAALAQLTTPDPAVDRVLIYDVSAATNKYVLPKDLAKYHADGTSALPAIAFESDLTKGIYSAGSNLLGFAIAGAAELILSGTALYPAGDTGSSLGIAASNRWAHLYLATGSTINWNNGDVVATHSANALAFTGASSGYSFDAALLPTSDEVAAIGASASAWAGLYLGSTGFIDFEGGDIVISRTAANTLGFAGAASGYQFSHVVVPTASDGAALGTNSLMWSDLFLASGGVINFNAGGITITDNADTLAFALASGGYTFDATVKPTSNDLAALGTGTVAWADLFLASGAVVNFNNGDVTITHAANQLTFSGGSNGYFFDTTIAPSVSDGAALGSTSFMWSDAFFASGAVVNFNNGDVTITHSANQLNFGGASVGYLFDGPTMPASNDAAALGASGQGWSDLFLASGAVINFNAGDVTITHSADLLTISGGALTVAAFTASGNVALNGGTFVYNDSGADLDFRCEGDTDANLFFLDASADKVGVGTATPSSKLSVSGSTGTIQVSSHSASDYTAFFANDTFGPAIHWLGNTAGTNNLRFGPSTDITGGGFSQKMVINSTGNIKIAGTAVRGTTEGTNHLDIFDGTAPAGTLANGVSLYSASGELRSMDAAGNSTLLSPHDKETNEWIYHSVDTERGRVLVIEIERGWRELNERFGLDIIHEYDWKEGDDASSKSWRREMAEKRA